VEADSFHRWLGGCHREFLYQIGPVPLFRHMNQVHIDGELNSYTRRGASRTDYGRLARTFLTAMFIGIILAGVYFAITPLPTG
jgi:hypothetical protein